MEEVNIDDINAELDDARRSQRNGTYTYQYAQRKRPVHGIRFVEGKPTIIYLTVVCGKRIGWLANDYHHQLLSDIWRDSSHWVVGRYVLMPEHLHLFASPSYSGVNLERWVQFFKSTFNDRNENGKFIWQNEHWDVRMRSQRHYEEKCEYMVNNPVRAGLVKTSSDWPYQGILHQLPWD